MKKRDVGEDKKYESQTEIENLHHISIDKREFSQFSRPIKNFPKEDVKDGIHDMHYAAYCDEDFSIHVLLVDI
jgi:hypothetical protein